MSPAKKKLAATYSRESYTIATIGNEAFDGRVRDGIGSGHFFIATKNVNGSAVIMANHDSLKTLHELVSYPANVAGFI